jgi:GT2 family glycosyltransferase
MTVLTYQKIDLISPSIYCVTVDRFYQQMLELQHKEVVYLDDYNPQNSNHVVITFDGLYKNTLAYATPILKSFNYPFELFLSSDFIGINNRFDPIEPFSKFANVDDLKTLVTDRGRLQWHTRSHDDLTCDGNESRLVDELTIPEEVRTIDPSGCNWFAYPYGKFDERLMPLVKQRFKGAVSCDRANDTDIDILKRIMVTNESRFHRATITVIIASYNYGAFLVEAIESVLRQTRLPDEILISDDASTDNTFEIAEFYQSQYPHLIRINQNETNLGIVAHFNKAVALTSGDYITILGADNRYLSDYVEKTAAVLDLNDDVAIAYTDFALFGKRASVVYTNFPPEKRGIVKANSVFIINFPEFTEDSKQELLQTRANFIHGSSMFRRKAFVAVGGYAKHADLPEDYDFFSRIILSGWQAKRSPDTLLEYRQHSKDQANIKLGSYAELHFYQDRCKTYSVENEELRLRIKEADRIVKSNNQELTQLKEQIYGMETSKFWKIRSYWFKLKRLLYLPSNE